MKAPTVAIIDYDIGNIKSMANALIAIGAIPLPTREPQRIAQADLLILPGVGAFQQGMENLKKYRLLDAIGAYICSGKPFLGICLGMQLLLEESEEYGFSEGMCIIKGRVRKLRTKPDCHDKLPHIGWNAIRQPRPGRWTGTVFETVADPSDLYFVHSFAVQPEDENVVLSVTDFGRDQFCSAVQKGAVCGFQFHPEKSGPAGLNILRRFLAIKGYEG